MATKIYANPAARNWTYDTPPDFTLVQNFHKTLPAYRPTPLAPLEDIARELGVKAVFVKDESNRLGLPAYKVLGASWGAFRSVTKRANLSPQSSIEQVAKAAQEMKARLYTATAGNHGRAVARMAKILGIGANIYVPGDVTDQPVKDNIASEGAEVITVPGIFDQAAEAAEEACKLDPSGLLIQDLPTEGDTDVWQWIIEGYSTLVNEVESQLAESNLKASVIATPIGAGTLGHAVATFCKSSGRKIKVLTTEPESAACLNDNLNKGRHETIPTKKTIMDGMNCGTVGVLSWPVLKEAVDVSVTVSDRQCHEDVVYLQKQGINAGPCGAAQLAGLRKVVREDPSSLELDKDSVVVLLSTEGKRYYAVPE
jgi:diaminopropionate ammonia-lyase family